MATETKAKQPRLVVKLLIGTLDHLKADGTRVVCEAGQLIKEGEHMLRAELEKLVASGKAQVYDLEGKKSAAADSASRTGAAAKVTTGGMSKVEPVAGAGNTAPVSASDKPPVVTAPVAPGPTFVTSGDEANIGNATLSAISATDQTKPGPYRLVFSSDTAYVLIGPDGKTLDTVSVLGAYGATDKAISFTVTAGDKPMAKGDELYITVTAPAETGK